jgi:hypothetical protein
MSSSYTSPRAGGTKPASTEEISNQIDKLRSQLQKLTSTVHFRHRHADQKHAGKPGDGDPG